MTKKFRIAFLFFIFVLVAGNTYITKFYATDWDIPLEVVVHPMNADGSEITRHYIDQLDVDNFSALADFLRYEAGQYEIGIDTPIAIALAPQVDKLPPEIPYGGNVLQIIWWSLKIRYWAWQVDNYEGPAADIKIFVLYYDPGVYKELDHSIGLEKGMLCLVKAYSSRHLQAKNNVIMAHELLHALGASDKYDYVTRMPVYPSGYAYPEQVPLYPQKEAEIMGAVIALSESNYEMPESLRRVMIGPETAQEINWIP